MEWISVKDELPEFDEQVLIITDKQQKLVTKLVSKHIDAEGETLNWSPDIHEITHWMPLPEPPKQ